MSCNCGINKTFILEPISLSGDNTSIRVCDGVYTNQVVSCSNSNSINLSVSGETIFNNSIKANLIDDINIVRGGAFIINDLSVIFNNPAFWYPKLIEGQIILTNSGGTNGVPQIFRLKDINQFDNINGWDKVVDEETHQLITITGSGTSVTFIAVPKPFNENKVNVFLNGVLQDSGLDYTLSVGSGNIILDFNIAPYILTNEDRIKIIYN